MDCIHCGDTGSLTLRLARVTEMGLEPYGDEYQSPCHACPAGAVLVSMVDALAEDLD